MTDDVFSPAPDDRFVKDEAPAVVIVRGFRQTWPWVALIGVLLAGSTALMFLGGVTMVLSGTLITLPAGTDPLGVYRFVGPIYLLLGMVYVVPTVLVLRFAFAAFRVSDGDGLAAAAIAVRRQRDLWIAIGVMALLLIIVYCGGMFALVAGVTAAVIGSR